jgi:ribonucleoside-diphosphate reductase alpha chain
MNNYGHNSYGPQIQACDDLHAQKYRLPNESFNEACARQAGAMSDNDEHRTAFKNILLNQRYMPAGRVQAAMGSPKNVTAYNCFVSGTIEDSMDSIMDKAKEAAETMRRGGGIGFDFSHIRPRNDRIVSLDSSASGPVSFMAIFDSVCNTIVSAGHRRGAMMSVLRVDHPDIEEFIRAKKDSTTLTNFNVSVGVTDEFMDCVAKKKLFSLEFEGRIYNTVDAAALWDEIMRNNWDWAEPGVLFRDRINDDNNLYYTETIEATNPCGEQPLPPYGACLLGSFNLVKYMEKANQHKDYYTFNYQQFKMDIPNVVRAMDNVIDRTQYPLASQEKEAKAKRRMGLGITGLANVLTLMGIQYGSSEAVRITRKITKTLMCGAYETSALLAKEKGAFPLYTEEYLDSKFIQRLPLDIQDLIKRYGIRNSHLTSIAPTGTISFTADNISSGVEPVFSNQLDRTVQTEQGPIIVPLKDYVYNTYNLRNVEADDLSTDSHIDMQIAVQPFVDSAVSKTINVSDKVTFDEFKDIYMKAWRGKLKGCTTFRLAGKRYGILNKVEPLEEPIEGAACFIDPATGNKECG